MRGVEYRRTTVCAAGLTSFLAGLVLARRIGFEWRVALLGIPLLPLLWRRNILSMLSISIIGLLLGGLRGTAFMRQLLPYHSLTKRLVTISATATSDAVYGDKAQIVFDVGAIELKEPYARKLVGTIGVKGYGEQMIYRGDVVEVQAKLYPTRGSRQARLSFAKIRRLKRGEGTVDRLRREFAAGLQSALPEPLGSLGLGILIGHRTTLPDSLNDDLSAVGLTHIVAVSGYNLTILVNFAHRLAKRRSKYQATIIKLVLIGVFLVITGSSASIIRAAVVSILSLWSWYYGRTLRPMVLILLAAVLTAGWFPAYIWSDLGWHLSFLAFIGVLILAPLFQDRFLRRAPKIMLQLFIETSAAQVLTLPILLFVFGRLSSIALLANMLVVPLVPIAMGLSFVAGLAGMLLSAFAGWVAWPATLSLTYMVDVIHMLAGLPKASVGLAIGVSQLITFYILLCTIMLLWWRKTSKNGKVKAIKARPLTEPVLDN